MSAYSFTPPPPPSILDQGGNRTNKHIVGGMTTNVGYAPGTDLRRARELYQMNQGQSIANPLGRGFFQGANELAPDYSQANVNVMEAGQAPNAAQALGNTLRQHSMGNIRAANAPSGLGFGRSNSLGVVRQHTITGAEGLDGGITYTPLPPPPPRPVIPSPKTPVTTVGGGRPTTEGGTFMPTAPPPVKGGPAPGIGTTTQTQRPLTVAEVNQGIRQSAKGWKVGSMVRDYAGTSYKITGGKMVNGVYVPLVGTGAKQQVHPAWRSVTAPKPGVGVVTSTAPPRR